MRIILIVFLLISNVSFCQSFEEFYKNGSKMAKAEDFIGAIEQYSKAIKLKPNFPSTYINRAFVYFKIGKNEESINDYTIYLKLKPGDSNILNNRGIIYEELGNYKAALDDFNNAMNIDNDNALFHLNKGNLLIKMNQFEEGIAELKIAQELNPSGDTSKYNRVGYFYPFYQLDLADDIKFPINVDIELYINDVLNFDIESDQFFLRFKYALYTKYPQLYISKNNDTLNKLTDLKKTVYVDYIKSDDTRIDELKYDHFNQNSGYQYSGSMEGSFYHNWDLRDYPFDEQKVKVRFKSKLDSTIFKFNDSRRYPSDFNKNMTGLKDGFQIEKITFKSSFEEDFKEINLSPTLTRKIINPIGVYEIIISRNGSWLFLKLFLGSFLAFVISWLVFTVPKTDFGSRIDLSVGAIFGAIGNKYFVESTTPAIQVLTKADIINNLVILMVLINVIIIIMQNNDNINFGKFEDSKFSFIFSGVTMVVLTFLTIII
jgi:tetratricopeptide (TPR) repeat protein